MYTAKLFHKLNKNDKSANLILTYKWVSKKRLHGTLGGIYFLIKYRNKIVRLLAIFFQILVLGLKVIFAVFNRYLRLGFRPVDPHFFADPTDPDPKCCLNQMKKFDSNPFWIQDYLSRVLRPH